MNNSAYYNYGHRIFYQFYNGLYQIPVIDYLNLEIQILDTITYAPKQHIEHIDPIYPSREDISLIDLINKSRPNIHSLNEIVIDIPSTKHTKQARLGISSSTSSPNSRRMVFTRGLKNVE